MKKKNGLFTFLFAMIPGAGQMYLGLTRRGISIMLPFCGIIWLASLLGLSELALFLPVIWFFAFFDTFNQRDAMARDECVHDAFLFRLGENWRGFALKKHTAAGWCCIALGAYMLYNSFIEPFLYSLYEISPLLAQLLNNLPRLIVIVLIILLGVYLITGGRRKSLPENDDFVEYGGDHHDRV